MQNICFNNIYVCLGIIAQNKNHLTVKTIGKGAGPSPGEGAIVYRGERSPPPGYRPLFSVVKESPWRSVIIKRQYVKDAQNIVS